MNENNSQKKSWSKIKNIASLMLPLVGFFIPKAIEDLIGTEISWDKYLLICVCVIGSVLLLYLLLALTISVCLEKLNPKYHSNDYSITDKCLYEDRVCCANIAIKAVNGDYQFTLNEEIAKKYNLVSEEKLIKLESNFKDGEIWVFSYDLTTETLEDPASKAVKTNLERGVIYREFYIDDDKILGNASANCEKMKKMYHDLSERIFFYPYNNPESLLNYMFALFGMILFINNTNSYPNVEAYFSLRSSDSRVKTPIYLKMPHCMTNQYYRILNQIKDNNKKGE